MYMIQFLGLSILTMMVSALAIDFGYYFSVQNNLQTVANSAALAAAGELYNSIDVDPPSKIADARQIAQELADENETGVVVGSDDVVFGFVDPATKKYNSGNFRTPSANPNYALTGGYNAVYVRIRHATGGSNAPIRTIMANMLGIRDMNADAEAIAMVDQTIDSVSNGGVRPIYACQAQFDRVMQDGIPQNDVVKIYGDHVEVNGIQNQTGCPAMGSGNWGFADLTNCNADAVGSSTISDWFSTGYPGTVNVGRCYSTNPGNFIPSIEPELDKLIADKTIFPIPLYNSWAGSGSNSRVDVSGFVGFQITGYKSNGPASERYIQGKFQRFNCKQGCSSTDTGATTPGGAVVKLRLAYRS
jgi:Flp pilus assembly protein TadG